MVLSDLDRTLLDRCLSGTDGAWSDFVERFLPLIVHVVNQTGRLRYGQLPDAWRDDLVADVLLALIDRDYAVLRRFQGQSSLGTYLVVVARRVVARQLTSLQRAAQASGNGGPHVAIADRAEADHFEVTERVEALLGRLSDREAQAIRMFHLEHRSYGEISSQLGMPENSVGPFLSRARTRFVRWRRLTRHRMRTDWSGRWPTDVARSPV